MSSTGTAGAITDPTTILGLSEEIDQRLEQYLLLLDQYTTLRSSLAKAQSSIHQTIARANFSAERGIRYGADFYDERMQATRVCRVTIPDHIDSENPMGTSTSAPVYTVVSTTCLEGKNDNGEAEEEKDIDVDEEGEEESKQETEQAAPKSGSKDPIRMFGVLVPPALKLAQAEALKMTEEIIPKLVSVDAEMKEIGIKIGRARKQRLKKQAKIEEASGLNGATASVG